MRAAFAVWNNRIAPVFDVAQELRLVAIESGHITSQKTIHIPRDSLAEKAAAVAECRITVVVCGAISRLLYDLLAARGIELIPFISGEFEEVLEAFSAGQLPNSRFSMPGCAHRNRRRGGYHFGSDVHRRNRVSLFPQCGYEEKHTRRIPCNSRESPDNKVPLRKRLKLRRHRSKICRNKINR